MSTVRIRGGDTERIQTPAVKGGDLAALTGLATVVLAIQRTSDGFWLDFNDSTFKSSGWTTRQQAMTEVSATLAPGEYRYDWTAPSGTNAYMIRIDETGGTAKNVPFVGEIKVDPWASPGDAMDLVANAVDAAAIATDAIDADAIAANAITSSEAPALANLDVAVSTRSSHDAADVDAQLSGTHGAGSWATATGFATPADLTALQAALEAYGDLNWLTATGFETEASAATREATNTAEHAATLAAVGALAFATPADLTALEAHGDLTWATATGFETESAAATREATNTAEHAATLAAVGLVPTVGEIDTELTANHGAGSWIEGSLNPSEALHLEEIWTVLGLNSAAPVSFDGTALFIQALAAGIDISIGVVGTTVTLTR